MQLSAADGPVSGAGTRLAGQLGMLWGVAGVSLLLLSAVFRLGAVALQTLRMDLDRWHRVACVVSLIFIGITEGYMAFQRGYSPRVAARALHLKDNPQLWHVVLAPVFCMGLIHATRRRLMSSWILAVAVILIIIAVRAPAPTLARHHRFGRGRRAGMGCRGPVVLLRARPARDGTASFRGHALILGVCEPEHLHPVGETPFYRSRRSRTSFASMYTRPVSDALAVAVDCYAGSQRDETPRRFTRESQLVEILAMVAQWRTPDQPVLQGQDGRG